MDFFKPDLQSFSKKKCLEDMHFVEVQFFIEYEGKIKMPSQMPLSKDGWTPLENSYISKVKYLTKKVLATFSTDEK